ncbi:MAG: glucose PTS transporter subunit IIA [Tissierellia bacterium]|nr:glucose PTS transporter subunit IIA [Tissierellia bacterium]
MKNNKFFEVLQRVGRSFMLPIAILPVAGLFLGIGGSFTNATMIEAYGLKGILSEGKFLYEFLNIMKAAGDIIFGNLPIIFAIGVAIGMAKAEKGTAALAGAISFFVMHSVIGAMITANGGAKNMLEGTVASVVGIQSLQMGVFGGIIVGLGVAALHNKYYKIQLPTSLSFFGGTRFVPIISAIVYLFIGILMFYIWPVVQNGIYKVGDLVRGSGYAGTWLYGFMERILIPFGLHHVFYLPFWQTGVGGSMEVNGVLIEGAQNIFFAQLADSNTTKFSVEATRFMSGKFPLMIFGLPGAALAMYQMAKPENRKIAGGLLFSAALTAMLTGITEPIEFTFLFVAPFLYVLHSIFAGAAYMLMHIFGVGVGMTFSGGLIDLTLFGILQGNDKTSWFWVVIVGIGYFVVYYLLFSFLVKKFNLKTPGRGEEEVKLYTRQDMQDGSMKPKSASTDQISRMISMGLGGHKNIEDVDSCATRLRCTVKDPSLVRKDLLTASGAAGVVDSGRGIQIIYGPVVSVIKSNLEEYLENPSDEEEITITEEVKKQEPNKAAGSDTVYTPIKGKLVRLENLKDEAFASKMMGDGIAIEPEEGVVYSPVNGEVALVFGTKHAVGLKSDAGAEILIHFGMDTVNLKGEGFEAFVSTGDKVKVGQKLLEVDLNLVKDKGYLATTPIIVTNSQDYGSIKLTDKVDLEVKDYLMELVK